MIFLKRFSIIVALSALLIIMSYLLGLEKIFEGIPVWKEIVFKASFVIAGTVMAAIYDED